MKQPVTREELKEILVDFRRDLEGGICTCPNMITKMETVEQLLEGIQSEIKALIETFREDIRKTNDRLSQLEVRVISLEAVKNEAANPALKEIMAMLSSLIGQVKQGA